MIKPVSIKFTNNSNFKRTKPSEVSFQSEKNSKNNSGNVLGVLAAAGFITLAALLANQNQDSLVEDMNIANSTFVDDSKANFSIIGINHKHNRTISGKWAEEEFNIFIKNNGIAYSDKKIKGNLGKDTLNLNVETLLEKFDRKIKGEFANQDVDIKVEQLLIENEREVKGKIGNKKVDFVIRQPIDNYDRNIKGIFADKELDITVDGNVDRYDRKLKGSFNFKEFEMAINGNVDACNRSIKASFDKKEAKELFLLYLVLREASDLGEFSYYYP